jgi:dTDP-4-amino-4,6-dideoxygalactose transaminase
VRYRAVLRTENPAAVIDALAARDVRAIVPLADWELLGDPDAFPNARDLTRSSVSLPLYPALSDAEQRSVLEALAPAA